MNIPKDDLFFDLLRSGLWDKAGAVADYSSVDWKALISNNKKSGRIPVASFVCRGTVTRTLDPLVPNQMR